MLTSFSDGFLELLRSIPFPVWLLLPLLCLSTSVRGVQDFNIYRMQHLDLHGTHIGSRSAVVNMEARSMGAAMLNRKCVVLRWSELSTAVFTGLMEKGAGSLLVLLPVDWRNQEDNVTTEWIELEKSILSLEVPIPVYLTTETSYLTEVYDKLSSSIQNDSSALGVLLSSVAGEGYSLIADAVEATPIENPEISTIVGKLNGRGYESDLPTVVMVTHYDSFGLAPSLSSGGDSGGSGVAAMLELARLFSKLYSNPHQHPKYNLLFVLTGGGNLNHFGVKYFIEDMLEDTDTVVLSESDYTICLDALAGGSDMFLHVSRPPKEGTKGAKLVSNMNKSLHFIPQLDSVTLNHKKIRIGDEILAWPHERFSLRKIPAATLSHFQRHTDPLRKSMFHTKFNVDSLVGSVQLIAETVARHILGLNTDENYTAPLFTGEMSVHKDYLEAWLTHLSVTPRSPQMLLSKEHPLLTSLQQTLSKYVDEVTTFSHKPDKNDLEFVVYTQSESVMHSHSVKPAVFDLVLALVILSYVGIIYLIVMYFPTLQNMIVSQFVPSSVKRKGD